MSDETTPATVPTGWVRLTTVEGETIMAPANAYRVSVSFDGCVRVAMPGDQRRWDVTESHAEVAALIADAQRAQRRVEVAPIMAAMMVAAGAGKYEIYNKVCDALDAVGARR